DRAVAACQQRDTLRPGEDAVVDRHVVRARWLHARHAGDSGRDPSSWRSAEGEKGRPYPGSAPPSYSRFGDGRPTVEGEAQQMATFTSGQQALVRFLQKQGILSAESAAAVEALCRTDGISVVEALEQKGILTDRQLAERLAPALRLRLV